MKTFICLSFLLFAGLASANDTLLDAPMTTDQAAQADEQESREPASAAAAPQALTLKKSYPGAGDEDDLQVQGHLPEAGLRIDARSVQREVFKGLYNQELKDDNRESVDE